MSETQQVTSVTEQPKAETITTSQDTVLSRLSQEFNGGEDVKIIDPIKTPEQTATQITEKLEGAVTPTVELTAEEKTALLAEAKELGLPETATKAEVDKFKADKEAETTWKLDEVAKSEEEEIDGTWKGLIETFELGEIPADYSEERGFDVVQDLFNKKLEAVKAEALTEAKYDRYADVPDEVRGEAELVVELMKSGQTLQQINEPFIELAQFKAMSKEELVRNNLMFLYKNDQEVVDNKMEKIIEGGYLDVEYKVAKADLDNYEQSLNAQRQEQVKNYQGKQRQIQEQRFNQESAKLNYALDRVPEYLGKKLTPEVKAQLKNELTSGKYHSIEGTPEDKVDYFLYRKFGKQGIANFKARAQEEVTLKNKQTQHNVPILENGAVNRPTPTVGNKTEVQRRLEAEFGTSQ